MLTLNTKELKSKLGIVARICKRNGPPRSAAIVVATVRETLTLRSYKVNVELSSRMTGDLDPDTGYNEQLPSVVAVDGKDFAAFIRGCQSSIVSLEIKDSELSLRSGGISVTLPSLMPSTDMPSAIKLPSDATVSLLQPDWTLDAKWTIQAMSSDETRRHLNALYMDGEGHMVATDGHRMHVAPCDVDQPVLIPALGAKLLPAICGKDTAQISVSETVVSFVGSPGVVLRCYNMTTDHKFPPWQQIVPKLDDILVRLELSVANIKEWTANLKGISTRDNSLAHFRVNGTVDATNSRTDATCKLPTSDKVWRDNTEDNDITVGFNSKYIVEALACGVGSLLVAKDSLSPARYDSEERVAVVMPCRL